MRKYTLSAIRVLVRDGFAHDITNADAETVLNIWRKSEKVGYSSGVYGINGGLLRDMETGETYAITARNSNLFRCF